MKPKVKLLTLVWLCIASMIVYLEVHRRRTLAESALSADHQPQQHYIQEDDVDDDLELTEEGGSDDLPGYSYDDTSLGADLGEEGAVEADKDSDPGGQPAKLTFDEDDDDTIPADDVSVKLTIVDVKTEEEEEREGEVQDGEDYEEEDGGSAASWSLPAYEDDEDGTEGEQDEEEYESTPARPPRKLALPESTPHPDTHRPQHHTTQEAAQSSGEVNGEDMDEDNIIVEIKDQQGKISIDVDDGDGALDKDEPQTVMTIKEAQNLALEGLSEEGETAEEEEEEEVQYEGEASQAKLSLDPTEQQDRAEEQEYQDEEPQPKLSLDLIDQTQGNTEDKQQSEPLDTQQDQQNDRLEPMLKPAVETEEVFLQKSTEELDVSEPAANTSTPDSAPPPPDNTPLNQSAVGDNRLLSPAVKLPVDQQSQRADGVNMQVEAQAEPSAAVHSETGNMSVETAVEPVVNSQTAPALVLKQQVSSPADTIYPAATSGTRAPLNTLPSPQQATPVKHSFFQYNYNYRSGGDLLRGKELWLRKDLLHSLDLLPLKYTQLNANTVKDFVFVTASSFSTFDASLETIASIQQFFPRHKILYFDLGLLEDQEQRVRAMCNVEYRPYYYERYPKTIQNPAVTRQVHRAMILQEAMRMYPGVFYIESPFRLLSSNVTSALSLAITNGGLVFFAADSRGDTLTGTHQDTLNFFPSTPMGLRSLLSMRTQAFLVYNTEKIFSSVLWWWYLCTLDGSCVPSTSCDLWSDPLRQLYADCRHFDQSVLNVLVANFYSFDHRWYFHQTPAVAAPARSDVIRVLYCRAPAQ